MRESEEHTYVTVRLAVLFAVASGLAVGNLYWAQPLLADIERNFGAAASDAGMSVPSNRRSAHRITGPHLPSG